MKLGIKCEIHSCTLKFMEELLIEYYSKEEIKIISKAFDLRTIAQYYVDKVLNTKDVDFILAQAPLFVNSSKSILSKINEKDVERIRKKISELLKN